METTILTILKRTHINSTIAIGEATLEQIGPIVLIYPNISISNQSFLFDETTGNTQNLTISNIAVSGASPLVWNIQEEELEDLPTKLEVNSSADKTLLENLLLKNTNGKKVPENYPLFILGKGDEDFRQGSFNGDGFGGPDTYGYSWMDSDEPGGPTFVWDDISISGVVISDWIPTGSYEAKDEGYSGPISLGFSFDFYGNNYDQVYVSSNGIVSFSPISNDNYTNQQIPSAGYLDNLIAPFWDDLDGRTQGDVHYFQNGSNFILQFTNWQKYSGSGSLTFQLVLNSSGEVYFYYSDMNAALNSSTVGIENQVGDTGLQIVFNSEYIHNGLAVRINNGVGWISENPASGFIEAGNNQLIEIVADPTDLTNGMYNCNLLISSNDPNQTIISIPVILVIQNPTLVNLKVFLEGCYDSGVMNTLLNTQGELSLNQPFNISPWNYLGTETITDIPTDVVDWVLVELRSGSDATMILSRRAALLKSNGMIMDLDGLSQVGFDAIDQGSYYIVVIQRNHLPIMSADPITLSNTASDLYDFTISETQAFGTNPMKDLGGGYYGMFAADANADGSINATDLNNYWIPQNGTPYNYQTSTADFNLDGTINATDLNNYWIQNNGRATQGTSLVLCLSIL